MGLRDRLRRGGGAADEPDYADDGTLPVLGQSMDPAASDSAVLAELAAAGVDVARPLLVRHHLLLPHDDAVRQAASICAQDGYAVAGEPTTAGWHIRVSRTETPVGRTLAQERTRMAGMAQRLGGEALGWDLCGR